MTTNEHKNHATNGARRSGVILVWSICICAISPTKDNIYQSLHRKVVIHKSDVILELLRFCATEIKLTTGCRPVCIINSSTRHTNELEEQKPVKFDKFKIIIQMKL